MTTVKVTKTGSATVTAGSISVDVPHGLSVTPGVADISLTPQDDLGGRGFWPSNPTSTQFTINISFADPETNHAFSWAVSYSVDILTVAGGTPSGTYCTSDDVKAFSKITYTSIGYANDADFLTFLNSLIAYAGSVLDEFCRLPEGFFNAGGYSVTAEMYDYKFPYMTLYVFPLYRLPPISLRYQPVISVSKVEYNTQGYGIAPSWVEIASPGYIFDPIACTITIVLKMPAMAQLSIRVTYTAGYITVPDVIRYTCSQLAANILQEILQRKLSPQVTPGNIAMKVVTPTAFTPDLQDGLKHFVRRFIGIG